MAATEIQLQRIQSKLQQLLKEFAVLQKENSRLNEKLELAYSEITANQENIDKLKQQVDVLKYSNGEMNEVDKKDFERKINAYVKEIDRCIVMLSQ
jgi:predicted nuclease with TOPRIM domain